jgi:peptidoglycan/LPS O-acetylase OafA/YrhL
MSPAVFRFLFHGHSFLNYFDSLAVGCIAAVLLSKHEAEISPVLNKLKLESILVGWVLILIPYILSKLSHFGFFIVPLGNTFQSAGFAILLLQSILSPQFFKALNWPVLRNLGILSYSIYIWQMIFCSNPKSFGLSDVWFMSFPGWLLAAILMATISYYGLEKPLLGLRAYFRKADRPTTAGS